MDLFDIKYIVPFAIISFIYFYIYSIPAYITNYSRELDEITNYDRRLIEIHYQRYNSVFPKTTLEDINWKSTLL